MSAADPFQLLRPDNLENDRDSVIQLATSSWPGFMWQDDIAEEYWHELFDRFSEYQPVLLETRTGQVAAIGHSLPFRWEKGLSELPEDGWDWVIQKAVKDHKDGLEPTMQAAIMVAIRADFQRQGLSARILQSLKGIGRSKGFNDLVVPVRPNQKSQYPLTNIDDYVTWKTADGLPFDAWLRVHVRAGGNVIKVCRKSKVIRGRPAEWEAWTGMKFLQSGKYILPDALNPLELDFEKDLGIYTEPNVWMVHETG